jgi:(1->4)-alpha-D-glucan 1-alpha-D-glucosylmutase
MTRPITATYRLQLNKDFTLHDAAARVPYLHALGISHLYCSPVLAARAGSMHGYDVADPTQVGAELGGDAAFVALAETAHRHGMGLVLDIVPNHMGIGPDNPFWDDLLTHGPASAYAAWFDVEWKAPTRKLADRVLLPVLGDTLDKVLDRGEFGLRADESGVRVTYFDHHFPLDPATLPPELALAQRDPSARVLLLSSWTSGDDGRARLAALLARQHYELAFWRRASRDINYRRFFDVNELIALRVEREDVFRATHRAVLEMVARGLVDGLRVDHVDGLLEPRRYLERLRAAVDAGQPRAVGDPRFPIYVEKILAPGERLPADWPVEGTTGYEFMITLEDVFVDPAGYERLETDYRREGEPGFPAVALEAKRRVLRGALNADVRRIAPMLAAVAKRAGWTPRSIGAHAIAIVELVACLGVYRTYIDAEQPEPAPADRAVLEQAFTRVRERRTADAGAVDELELALLGRWGGAEVEPALARARLAFVLRWQQLTGPAAAKGVEDTALYMYAPLASRNEVGGDPGVPLADALPRLRTLLEERAASHPRSLNATNTHDTKRSADVRSRLDALSEHAREWRRQLAHWRRFHRDHRTLINGRLAPTRTTDNFIYQSLLGIWPVGAAPARDGEPIADGRALDDLRERLTAYIQKAVREAKVRTSWRDPDAGYEAAITRFIEAILDRRASGPFLRAMEQFAERVAPQGMWNALSRVVIHLTVPGVPDLYQGDELWNQAMVDPDNRRPVDWGARDASLDAVRQVAAGDAAAVGSLLTSVRDGRLKLYIIHRLLQFRRDHAAMMAHADVAFSETSGVHAGHVVAYERALGPDAVLVVVPRLTSALGDGPPVGAVWGDTAVAAQDGDLWRCLLSGREHRVTNGALRVADLLGTLPVGVLARVRDGAGESGATMP